MVYSAMSDVFALGIWNIKRIIIYKTEYLNHLNWAQWILYQNSSSVTWTKAVNNFKEIRHCESKIDSCCGQKSVSNQKLNQH